MAQQNSVRLRLATTLQALDGSLQDDARPCTEDIALCGETVLHLIRACSGELYASVRGVQNVGDQRVKVISTSKILIVLETLVGLSKEYIDSVPFNMVSRSWLRLFTDASLLWSICYLFHTLETNGIEILRIRRKVMRRLDMAIIIAGAVGEDRMAWIQNVLGSIRQLSLCSTPHAPQERPYSPRPFKRARIVQPLHRQDNLLFAPSSIPVLKQPPSIVQYLDTFSDRPFILESYLDGSGSTSLTWPAVEKWASASYLINSVGEDRVVPVEVGGSYNDSEWGQRILSFRRFLSRAGFRDIQESDLSEVEEGDGDEACGVDARSKADGNLGGANVDPSDQPLYLAQHSLLDQFPELAKDISYPDYVWSCPPATAACPSYRPPETEDGVIVNVWVGSGGEEIVSPAHTDPYYNCYAQVLGQKRVWLAPPDSTSHMSSYGDPDRSQNTEGNQDALTDMYMTNTSQVPLLRPIEDFQQLRHKFPDFFKHVWPTSMEAILRPGDLLVMPPGWWHAMRGEGDGPGWSVSMWY